jgi:hypothetical protein
MTGLKKTVLLLPIPPYSPDLNPIENIWPLIKSRIIKAHPKLNEIRRTDRTKQLLVQAAVEAWERIEDKVLDNLWKSMPQRLTAVSDAQGWYTKYQSILGESFIICYYNSIFNESIGLHLAEEYDFKVHVLGRGCGPASRIAWNLWGPSVPFQRRCGCEDLSAISFLQQKAHWPT